MSVEVDTDHQNPIEVCNLTLVSACAAALAKNVRSHCSALDPKSSLQSMLGEVNMNVSHCGKTTASVLLEKMSVDIDATADLLFLIQQKLCIVQY